MCVWGFDVFSFSMAMISLGGGVEAFTCFNYFIKKGKLGNYGILSLEKKNVSLFSNFGINKKENVSVILEQMSISQIFQPTQLNQDSEFLE